MRAVILGAALAWAIAPASATATTVVLTFAGLLGPSGAPIVGSEPIPPDHGDVPGVVDVRYGAIEALQSAVRRLDDHLRYWATGYGDLVDVAFCCGIGGTGAAEIALVPLNGQPVTLHGMDFGDYLGRNDPWQVAVFGIDDLTTPLFHHQAVEPRPATRSFANLDITHPDGLLIRWETAYNVGIDNVAFTVTPLPPAALMLGAGLAALGLARRRRLDHASGEE